MKYNAFVVREISQGKYAGSVEQLDTAQLPSGEVLVKVEYSSINYKDALSFSGNKGVTRNFPHTPGIDAVGKVVASDDSRIKVGQSVIVTGYDLGMNTAGGYGEFIRVPASWVVIQPRSLNSRAAMAWGTAGLTAALCLEKLLATGLVVDSGPVLVSGGTGGVGSIAIQLFKKLGFEVHALTTKPDAEAYLKSIGASKVLLLDDFKLANTRPLSKPEYAGAVDVAGGDTLGVILKVLHYHGSVACCGLVDDVALNITVLPFILRGVNLLGVDSVELPLTIKQATWERIASDWALPNLESDFKVITKDQLSDALNSLINKTNTGRYILAHN